MSYLELKSGTDIRGFASEKGGNTVNLTQQAVFDITNAFVFWFCSKNNVSPKDLKISVGHDSRITAEIIKAQVLKAITLSGATAIDCGLSSTPAMFMTTIDLNADAAIQITASHHPFDRNGLKFFVKSGGLDSKDISKIVALADENKKIDSKSEGSILKENYMITYAARLRKMICDGVKNGETPLKGYHIIVDAGNGAGGFYAENVLAPLGADISGSQFLEPDGMFPNHIPNPEDKTAMASICSAVKKTGADLGLIFDTDVDRAACVDCHGTEINRNRLIALAAIIATENSKGATIVTDSVTSAGLKTFINEDLKGNHYRYKRGYKNVINKAIQLNEQGIDCPIAIETSGHAAFRENFFLDDGAYLVTKIVIELARGQNIDSLLQNLKMPAEEKEVRFKILTDDFRTYGQGVIADLEKFVNDSPEFTAADDNREGLRVLLEDGWFLLRLSVHDPVMPMNFESDTKGGIDEIIKKIKPFFERYDLLDTLALK